MLELWTLSTYWLDSARRSLALASRQPGVKGPPWLPATDPCHRLSGHVNWCHELRENSPSGSRPRGRPKLHRTASFFVDCLTSTLSSFLFQTAWFWGCALSRYRLFIGATIWTGFWFVFSFPVSLPDLIVFTKRKRWSPVWLWTEYIHFVFSYQNKY